MSTSPPTDRLRRLASFRAQHRAELLTVVFTDMVGSTRLKQELGDAEAVRLMQEHHALVRTLLAEFPTGLEVNTQGDSFFIAFSRPSDAVRFALLLQKRLRDLARRSRFKLSDRVGIHVGEVLLETRRGSDDIEDLNGLEVDKCARVMSLADAGRILLTRPAYDMARGALRGAELVGIGSPRWFSHGSYELKGVAEPVEVFEVADSRVSNLPPPPDSEKARRIADPVVTPQTRQLSHRSLAVGVLLSVLAGLVFLRGPLANWSYDLTFLLRTPEVPTNAVIIAMDLQSHSDLQQSPELRWSRGLHAQLIETLATSQVSAIVFDVAFPQPDPDRPADDTRLVTAARNFGKVVVAAAVEEVRDGMAGESILAPFVDLRTAATWGTARYPLFDRVRQPDDSERSLARAALRALGTNPPALSSRAWLNYYGRSGTVPKISYAEVLHGNAPPDLLAGRIVFVGADYKGPFPVAGINRTLTGTGTGVGTDTFLTPYTLLHRESWAGVELVATEVLNRLRGDFLLRLPALAEIALVVACAALSMIGLARLRPLASALIALGVGLLLPLIGWWSTWWTGWWFPWLTISLVQLPLALLWCSLLRLEQLGGISVAGTERPPASRTASGAPASGSAPAPASGPQAFAPGAPTVAHAVTPALPDFPPAPIPDEAPIPNYELLKEIGRGGYGEVWLARDTVGILRAIKIVHRRSFTNAAPYEREFEGIRRFTPLSLQHPGLIHVLHVGRDDARGWFYYVMEAADDEHSGADIHPVAYRPLTLDSHLRRRGALPVLQAVNIGLTVAEALGYLHGHRLVHRDVKPANILFVSGKPKLADVGLVTHVVNPGEEISQVGTHGYLPPEGAGSVAADIYALGKLMYVAVSGRSVRDFPEFPDDLQNRPDANLFLRLHAVLKRACEPEPERRPATMEELAAALRDICPPLPPARPPTAEGL